MRWIVWLLLLLAGLGWLACQLPLRGSATGCQSESDGWRRTQNGWEPATWLGPEIPVRCPAVHPAVVGLLQLLLSLFVLTAFSGCRSAARSGDRGSRRTPNREPQGPERVRRARSRLARPPAFLSAAGRPQDLAGS